MNFLLVEDDAAFVEGLVPRLRRLHNNATVTVAGDRDTALQFIQHGFYDIVILDLKIPSTTGAGDAAVENGQQIFTEAQRYAPGTPIFILTGSSADPFVHDLLKRARQEDVWGERKDRPTVDLLPKDRLPEFLHEMGSLIQSINITDQIETATKGNLISLTPEERRVVRIFARRRDGVMCEISTLSGGLSGSRVLRIKVHDKNGALQMDAAGKISSIEVVEDESKRYERFVVRLPPGSYPTRVEVIEFGAKSTGGIFYSLLAGFDESVFDVFQKKPKETQKVSERLQAIFEHWQRSVPTTPTPIREIRRRLVTDEKASQLFSQYGLRDLAELEEREVQTRWCCIHGDLHGANILINHARTPMLIDFGEVEPGPAALDPVTLELSVFFHPDAARITVQGDTVKKAALWADVTKYAEAFEFGEFILACRKWAHAVSAGDREVYACAYAYVLRQLKYPETNKEVAMALINAIAAAIRATY